MFNVCDGGSSPVFNLALEICWPSMWILLDLHPREKGYEQTTIDDLKISSRSTVGVCNPSDFTWKMTTPEEHRNHQNLIKGNRAHLDLLCTFALRKNEIRKFLVSCSVYAFDFCPLIFLWFSFPYGGDVDHLWVVEQNDIQNLVCLDMISCFDQKIEQKRKYPGCIGYQWNLNKLSDQNKYMHDMPNSANKEKKDGWIAYVCSDIYCFEIFIVIFNPSSLSGWFFMCPIESEQLIPEQVLCLILIRPKQLEKEKTDTNSSREQNRISHEKRKLADLICPYCYKQKAKPISTRPSI